MTPSFRRFLRGERREKRNRQADREHGPRPVGAICGSDGPAHRLDEATADCQTETRAHATAIRTAAAIEFLEDPLRFTRGNARPFVAYPHDYMVIGHMV